MTVGVQRLQTLLVTTERALWRYGNVFLFTNQSEVDFGITLVDEARWAEKASCISGFVSSIFLSKFLPIYLHCHFSTARR